MIIGKLEYSGFAQYFAIRFFDRALVVAQIESFFVAGPQQIPKYRYKQKQHGKNNGPVDNNAENGKDNKKYCNIDPRTPPCTFAAHRDRRFK